MLGFSIYHQGKAALCCQLMISPIGVTMEEFQHGMNARDHVTGLHSMNQANRLAIKTFFMLLLCARHQMGHCLIQNL